MQTRTIRNNILPQQPPPCKTVNDPASPEETTKAFPSEGEDPHVLESASLFRGTREVVIRHEGRIYRLRRTRLGKLILTA